MFFQDRGNNHSGTYTGLVRVRCDGARVRCDGAIGGARATPLELPL